MAASSESADDAAETNDDTVQTDANSKLFLEKYSPVIAQFKVAATTYCDAFLE